jgi:hypothetical protein
MSRRWSPLSIVALILLGGCYLVDSSGTSSGPGECTEEECGPAPGAPNIECEDGSIGGPSCERNEDDECAWVIRECPEADDECTPEECGPAPAAPNFLCDDGSVGGPGPCERNDSGVCGWTFRDCPP